MSPIIIFLGGTSHFDEIAQFVEKLKLINSQVVFSILTDDPEEARKLLSLAITKVWIEDQGTIELSMQNV